MAIRTVGIISAGDMGAAIASVLTHNGMRVVTSLTGRSDLTRLRASEAKMEDVGSVDVVVTQADVYLSVLVPAKATAIAQEVASSMRRTGGRPVFVECNAIAPQTVEHIGTVISNAGATFVDAGIIGAPPRPERANTRIYCSGPNTSTFEELRDYGLNIRHVGPRIGQASGLKMVYAASTKGTTALWTELLVAARSMGLMDALMDEFSGNDKEVRHALINAVPEMPRRARRWVGEMEEIALTFQHLGLTPKMLDGAADMFRLVGGTQLADQTSREPDPELDTILDVLADRLREASRLQ